MTFSEVLGAYQSQLVVLNNLWALLAILTLGLVGFSFTGSGASLTVAQRTVVSCLFLVLAVGNLLSIRGGQGILIELARHAEAASMTAPNLEAIARRLQPSSLARVTAFHGFIDASAALLLILPPFVSRRSSRPLSSPDRRS